MKKERKEIIKMLYKEGCFTKENSLYFDAAQKTMQDSFNIGLEEFNKHISALWREGYINNEGLNKVEGGWRCLPLTEKARNYVVDYLDKKWLGRFLYWCKENAYLVGFITLIVTVISLIRSIIR